MPYDMERYPGLYSLRESLGRRKTELPTPRPEGQFGLGIPRAAEIAERSMMVDRNATAARGQGGTSDLTNAMRLATMAKGGAAPGMPSAQGQQSRTGLGSWGGKKFAGDVTSDQFVSLAGALSQAIAPETPMGRVGGVLSQFGQQERQRRLGQEEALRKEAVEKRKELTEAELGIGKEERGRLAGIETAKTLAETQKETARIKAGARLKEFETTEVGKTKRAETLREHQKALQTQKDVASMAREMFKAEKKALPGEKGLTSAQLATQRKGAITQAQKELDAEWEEAGGAINPLTGESMTPKQKRKYLIRRAENIMKFTLGESEFAGHTGEW